MTKLKWTPETLFEFEEASNEAMRVASKEHPNAPNGTLEQAEWVREYAKALFMAALDYRDSLKCPWSEDEDGICHTGCGHEYAYEVSLAEMGEGTANSFCQGCGHRIEVVEEKP